MVEPICVKAPELPTLYSKSYVCDPPVRLMVNRSTLREKFSNPEVLLIETIAAPSRVSAALPEIERHPKALSVFAA